MVTTLLVFAACALVSACAFLAVALVVHRHEFVAVAAVFLPLGVFALALGLDNVDWRVFVKLAVVYLNAMFGALAGIYFAEVILERRARSRRHG